MTALVNNLVATKLYEYLEDHPAEAKIILDKSIASSNAREAAQKAREKGGSRSSADMPLGVKATTITAISRRARTLSDAKKIDLNIRFFKELSLRFYSLRRGPSR